MSEPTETAPGEKPAEKKEKKKRLKGAAGMLSNILKPLNDSSYFKEQFADEVLSFVVNATDLPPAVLIKVDKGTIAFEEVQPEDVKKVKASGLLQGTLDEIMKVAMSKGSSKGKGKKKSSKFKKILGFLKPIIAGKIKVKGALKLLRLNKLFSIATRQPAASTPPAGQQEPAPAAPATPSETTP